MGKESWDLIWRVQCASSSRNDLLRSSTSWEKDSNKPAEQQSASTQPSLKQFQEPQLRAASCTRQMLPKAAVSEPTVPSNTKSEAHYCTGLGRRTEICNSSSSGSSARFPVLCNLRTLSSLERELQDVNSKLSLGQDLLSSSQLVPKTKVVLLQPTIPWHTGSSGGSSLPRSAVTIAPFAKSASEFRQELEGS